MNSSRNTLCNILSLVCILTLLSACVNKSSQQSASGREEQNTPITKEVPGVEKIQLGSLETIPAQNSLNTKYRNIIIGNFKSSEQIQKDYPRAVLDCKTYIIEQLKSKNAYKNVSNDTSKTFPGKSVIVNLDITDMRITSGAARFWGGAFAGNSFMDVLLEVQDAATKEVVHKKVLSTSNNAWGASFSGGSTDQSLPADFGLLIGEYIFKNIPASN